MWDRLVGADLPRPAGRPENPVPDRDVGALHLLRDACGAHPVFRRQRIRRRHGAGRPHCQLDLRPLHLGHLRVRPVRRLGGRPPDRAAARRDRRRMPDPGGQPAAGAGAHGHLLLRPARYRSGRRAAQAEHQRHGRAPLSRTAPRAATQGFRSSTLASAWARCSGPCWCRPARRRSAGARRSARQPRAWPSG